MKSLRIIGLTVTLGLAAGCSSRSPSSLNTSHGGASVTTTTTTPQPSPISLSGSGDATPSFQAAGGLAVLTANCGCSGNFAVDIDDSSGNQDYTPIDADGSYSGSVGENLNTAQYTLDVTADGPWTIDVTQPRDQPGAALPHKYSGKGQKIVGPFAAGSAVRLQSENTTADGGNFTVEVLNSVGSEADIPVDEVGSYSGSTISSGLSGTPYYLDVDSDGTWSITVSSP